LWIDFYAFYSIDSLKFSCIPTKQLFLHCPILCSALPSLQFFFCIFIFRCPSFLSSEKALRCLERKDRNPLKFQHNMLRHLEKNPRTCLCISCVPFFLLLQLNSCIPKMSIMCPGNEMILNLGSCQQSACPPAKNSTEILPDGISKPEDYAFQTEVL
jgi:hypothetical protein